MHHDIYYEENWEEHIWYSGENSVFSFLQQSSAGLHAAVLKEKWFINKMQWQQKTFPPSFLSALMTHSSLPVSLRLPSSSNIQQTRCWANRLHFPGGIMSTWRALTVSVFSTFLGAKLFFFTLDSHKVWFSCSSAKNILNVCPLFSFFVCSKIGWITLSCYLELLTFMLIFYRKEYESMENLLFMRFSFFKSI